MNEMKYAGITDENAVKFINGLGGGMREYDEGIC
jgi:hypothetical protein